jgi:CheY-like chemotaxis protein
VSIGATCDDKNRIVLEVADTGSGISPEVLKHIFEPFFTTKDVEHGTGLGLAICQGIVTSLGGEIHVESALGKGSTFRVILPAANSGPGAAPVVSAKQGALLRGRILVVDDEEAVLRTLKRVLRNHELVCLESAREALELLKRGARFDLILCDVTMPTMTGMAFYEALLAHDPDIARRIVFLSGGAMTADVEDFLRSVPNPCIEKPFEVVRMLETVQQLLASATTFPTVTLAASSSN